jgi:hypothetical protein
MREAFVARTMSSALKCLAAAAAVAVLAGCADGEAYGDPGATPLAGGQTCGSIRSELDRLDSKGTQPKVEAASRGKKLPPGAQADVDRYHYLLNQYLGARCHVM